MNKINDELWIAALSKNLSIKAALEELGLAISGGNYKRYKKIIEKYKLDITHLNPNLMRSISKKNTSRQPIENLLTKNSKYNKWELRKRIIKEKIIEYKCAICGLCEWLGVKISLHLDHINGSRFDNRIENLRFLCPNCHSLTPTYCGKANKIEDKMCVDCGKKIDKRAKRCLSCSNFIKSRPKINWPSLDELINMIDESSYLAVSRKLGVSDNAIRKHIKLYKNK